ncbi:hypothetical protein HDU93_003729 [Gonapodya sp. JEL0774]|nr:hypothetical protein HDU93_003729 [Gonapodya sp. JEL0774]
MGKRKSYIELSETGPSSAGQTYSPKDKLLPSRGPSRSNLRGIEVQGKSESKAALQETRDRWISRSLYSGMMVAVFLAGAAIGRFGVYDHQTGTGDPGVPMAESASGVTGDSGVSSSGPIVHYAGTRAYPVDQQLPVGPPNGTKADALAAVAAAAAASGVKDFEYPYNYTYAPWKPAVPPPPDSKGNAANADVDPSEFRPGSVMRVPDWVAAAIAAAETTQVVATAGVGAATRTTTKNVYYTARRRVTTTVTTTTTFAEATQIAQTCDTETGWMAGTGTTFTCVCDWTRGFVYNAVTKQCEQPSCDASAGWIPSVTETSSSCVCDSTNGFHYDAATQMCVKTGSSPSSTGTSSPTPEPTTVPVSTTGRCGTGCQSMYGTSCGGSSSAPAAPPPAPSSGAGPGFVVYMPNWGGDITTIDLTGINVVNYAFYSVGANGELMGVDSGLIYALNTLSKRKYPGLKSVLSVGGWTSSTYFSDVAKDPTKRWAFASNVAAFLNNNGFDGVDIDWEYPGGGGESYNTVDANDASNFLLMLKDLRSALGAGKLITIASSASVSTYKNLLPQMAQVLDWINLMTYDLCNGAYSGMGCFNAPLYPDPASPYDYGSVSGTVSAFLNAGVPKNKLATGLAFYGHGTYVSSTANSGLYQPSSGTAGYLPWRTLRGDGYLNSPLAAANEWIRSWWNAAQVPSLLKGTTFISYDDTESIKAKVLYTKSLGLGGVMVWELSEDMGSELSYAIRANWGVASTASLSQLNTAESAAEPSGPWVLTWSEEFSYSGIPDPKVWKIKTGVNSSMRGEVYSAENAKVENGMLVLSATRGKGGWTTGCIDTENLMHFKYGRMEIRVKLPVATETWSTVSLLCGEIDVLEYTGSTRGKANAALQTQFRFWQNATTIDASGWNAFAIEWSANSVTFFANGKVFWSANKVDFGDTVERWPFDDFFYLTITMAIGSGQTGTDSSQAMLVDYVRFYSASV